MSKDDHKWDNAKKELLYRRVHESAPLAEGSGGVFVALADESGVNLYRNQEQRDHAMHAEKRMSEHSATAGDSFEVPWRNLFTTQPDGYTAEAVKNTIYGYIVARGASGTSSLPSGDAVRSNGHLPVQDAYQWDSLTQSTFFHKVHEGDTM